MGRPKRTAGEAADAARRIHHRRRRNHGLDVPWLPAVEDLLGMVRHVRKYQDRPPYRIPDGILRDDLADVTVILDYLERALDVERLGTLQLGRRMMPLAELAGVLGLEGRAPKQAVLQWSRRLRAVAEGLGPKDATAVAKHDAAMRVSEAAAEEVREAAVEAWWTLVDLRREGLLPDALVDDMRELAYVKTLPAAVVMLRGMLGVLSSPAAPVEVRAFAAIAGERLAA